MGKSRRGRLLPSPLWGGWPAVPAAGVNEGCTTQTETRCPDSDRTAASSPPPPGPAGHPPHKGEGKERSPHQESSPQFVAVLERKLGAAGIECTAADAG